MSLEEINLTGLEPSTDKSNKSPVNINLADTNSLPSANFGPGIELLMNDKIKNSTNNSTSNTSIAIDDLENLEKSLENLASNTNNNNSNSNSNNNNNNANPPSIIDPLPSDKTYDKSNNNDKNVKFNISSNESNSNWDGFSKINTTLPTVSNPNPPMSKEDELREKFKYVKKLEALEKKGIQLTKHYTMESSLLEMQGEYETLKNEKEIKNSINFQGRMLMACVTGIEFLNNKFDPFDFKLDGWGEQVNENLDDYDEIFAELHEKYQSKAKIAPELKLLFQLSGSAIMLHMTNTMFKSAMPGMDDIMRQNPDLMQQFTKVAMDQMSDENPGFGNFMNDLKPNNYQPTSTAGPPPPMQTKQQSKQDMYSTRPDLGFGKGSPTPGISTSQQFDTTNVERSSRFQRPEMKGPELDDISSLLQGLKAKPVITQQTDKLSTVSIEELNYLTNAKKPKKNKQRKNQSERNTVSLDLGS